MFGHCFVIQHFRERDGCFTLIVFLMTYQCSVALPNGAVGWSAV